MGTFDGKRHDRLVGYIRQRPDNLAFALEEAQAQLEKAGSEAVARQIKTEAYEKMAAHCQTIFGANTTGQKTTMAPKDFDTELVLGFEVPETISFSAIEFALDELAGRVLEPKERDNYGLEMAYRTVLAVHRAYVKALGRPDLERENVLGEYTNS